MALQVAHVAGATRPAGNRPPLGLPAKTAAGDRPSLSFRLLGRAQSIMGDREPAILRNGVPGWEYRYRVARCHRDTSGGGGGPRLTRSPDRSRAEFRDVYTCGSVWHCPVCAPKVASQRRDELSAALAVWTQAGGAVHLLTFTNPHERDAALADQVERQRGAFRALTGSRAYRDVMQQAFAAGAIRACEVTHGEWHGWHSHRHMLLFTAPGMARVLSGLRKLWVRALIKAGLHTIRRNSSRAELFGKLRDMLRHALDIRDGAYAAEYVAKFGREAATEGGGRWGIGSELTRGHVKNADRHRGRTPFRLLAMAADGDKRAEALYREYAVAFHGARQLYWSPGLRSRLLTLARCARRPDLFRQRQWIALLSGERDDEAIAAQADKRCTEHVATLTWGEWRVVLSRRARGIVLDVAREGTQRALRFLLDALRGQPPTTSGEFEATESIFRGMRAA